MQVALKFPVFAFQDNDNMIYVFFEDSALKSTSTRTLREEGYNDVTIIDRDTEEDILRSASLRLDTKRLDYLRLLTRSWQTIAYAHRVPDGDNFEQLVFCWSEQFNRDSEQV